MSTDDDGFIVATVVVRGTLCISSAPTLVNAVDDLFELGVSDVVVDVASTTPCPRDPGATGELLFTN